MNEHGSVISAEDRLPFAARAAYRGDSPAHWHYAAAKGGMVAMHKTIARAYAAAANAAIAEAQLVKWQRIARREFEVSFAKSSEFERLIANSDFTILSREFVESGVKVMVEGPEQELLKLKHEK